jgi:hypothetical protein
MNTKVLMVMVYSLCLALNASKPSPKPSLQRTFKLKLPPLILPKQTVEEMLQKKLDGQQQLFAQTSKAALDLSAQLAQEKKELAALELHKASLDAIRIKHLHSDKKKFDALEQYKIPSILHHYLICNLSPERELRRLRKSIQLHERLFIIAKQKNETLPVIIKNLKKDLVEEHMA